MRPILRLPVYQSNSKKCSKCNYVTMKLSWYFSYKYTSGLSISTTNFVTTRVWKIWVLIRYYRFRAVNAAIYRTLVKNPCIMWAWHLVQKKNRQLSRGGWNTERSLAIILIWKTWENLKIFDKGCLSKRKLRKILFYLLTAEHLSHRMCSY